MRTGNPEEFTQLLAAWSKGNEEAFEQLIQIVYDELRRLAHHYLRNENPGQTLQTTALVNEAYLRLAQGQKMTFTDRAHFFAVCARVMRHILIDIANSKKRQKRNAGEHRVDFEEALTLAEERDGSILALDDALKTLEKIDPRKAQVVELRYFGGLSVEETATVLKVSADTVMSDWRKAKLLLKNLMLNATASVA